jgi:hypothetical protein
MRIKVYAIKSRRGYVKYETPTGFKTLTFTSKHKAKLHLQSLPNHPGDVCKLLITIKEIA